MHWHRGEESLILPFPQNSQIHTQSLCALFFTITSMLYLLNKLSVVSHWLSEPCFFFGVTEESKNQMDLPWKDLTMESTRIIQQLKHQTAALMKWSLSFSDYAYTNAHYSLIIGFITRCDMPDQLYYISLHSTITDSIYQSVYM